LASERVHVVDHPLVQHKLSILRNSATSTKQFRELVREISYFVTYEATRDLPLRPVDVPTPIATARCNELDGKKLAVVPILRAGLGMLEGVLDMVPAAHVGHLGMARDEVTHEPDVYYCKLPADIDRRVCLVVDPMLATGGSLVASIAHLRAAGAADIRLLCVLAAPEGVARVLESDPRVRLYVGAVDDCLNERAYIVPGLGDAGDRVFGTD
jgi:uracil phosphoribosyltransferase